MIIIPSYTLKTIMTAQALEYVGSSSSSVSNGGLASVLFWGKVRGLYNHAVRSGVRGTLTLIVMVYKDIMQLPVMLLI